MARQIFAQSRGSQACLRCRRRELTDTPLIPPHRYGEADASPADETDLTSSALSTVNGRNHFHKIKVAAMRGVRNREFENRPDMSLPAHSRHNFTDARKVLGFAHPTADYAPIERK
ncbi:hypothetical protein GCM10009504_18670 [Pseudomonas laurentiana]|nr:hypothetical protein GCM10009504_18670 [Pseudomonas laurentiana]